MNNSVYGKTMNNLRKKVKVIKTIKICQQTKFCSAEDI